MKAKKLILIILVFLLVICGLVVILVMLTQQQSQDVDNTQTPSSYPDIADPDNKDEITEYYYAIIKNNDNIDLRTQLGETLLINLQERKWKDIQWSAQGSYVTALGETQTGIYNLFVYNLSSKKWVQVTAYEQGGVSSHLWIDNDTLLFTAGGWVHRYKYSTITEVIKVYQTDSQIYSLSPNKSTILLKNDTPDFSIISLDGRLLFKLNTITIPADRNQLITDAMFNKDSNSLLLTTNKNNVYSWKLGEREAKLLNLDPEQYSVVCSQEVNNYITYTLEPLGFIKLYKYDINEQTTTLLAEKNFNTMIQDLKVVCKGDKDLFIKIEFVENLSEIWYKLEQQDFVKVVVLGESKEFDIK